MAYTIFTVLGAFSCFLKPIASSNAMRHDTAIVSEAGETAVIKGWHIQSSSAVSKSIEDLSRFDIDVTSWYRVGGRGTIMV